MIGRLHILSRLGTLLDCSVPIRREVKKVGIGNGYGLFYLPRTLIVLHGIGTPIIRAVGTGELKPNDQRMEVIIGVVYQTDPAPLRGVISHRRGGLQQRGWPGPQG